MPRGYRLEEQQRRAVLNRLAAGYSYGETTAATGVPRGTVGHIGRQAIATGRIRPRVLGRFSQRFSESEEPSR